MPYASTIVRSVAIVTGASQGIGRAIAIALAHADAHVALVARSRSALVAIEAEIRTAGGRAVAITADLTDPASVDLMVERATDLFDGILDVLVNNAGGNSFSTPFTDRRDAGGHKTMALNLDSVMYVCRAAAGALTAPPQHEHSRSVINVSSLLGSIATPQLAHYGAAKAAMISRSLAAEWAPAGVRVNALVPGWVLTKSMQTLRDDPSNEALWAAIPPIALRRWATETEIARPALFLAGDASSYMTGQALFIDGGASLGIAQ